MWSDSSQHRLRGQTGRQGGSEGKSRRRRRAVDPGWGGQLQPLHQQVRASHTSHTTKYTACVKYSRCQDLTFRMWNYSWTVWGTCGPRGNQLDVHALKQIWLFFTSPCRYEVDDIDEEGKEWVLFNRIIFTLSSSQSSLFCTFIFCLCVLFPSSPSFIALSHLSPFLTKHHFYFLFFIISLSVSVSVVTELQNGIWVETKLSAFENIRNLMFLIW